MMQSQTKQAPLAPNANPFAYAIEANLAGQWVVIDQELTLGEAKASLQYVKGRIVTTLSDGTKVIVKG